MEKKEVSCEEKYFIITMLIKGPAVRSNIDFEDPASYNFFSSKNYFNTKEEAETIAAKLRAVLNGADIIEEWEREKITSWDTMLETKDEVCKSLSSLLNNPKIKAVLKSADAIQWPSDKEITEKATEIGDRFSKDVEISSQYACSAEIMANWLKSKKIVK